MCEPYSVHAATHVRSNLVRLSNKVTLSLCPQRTTNDDECPSMLLTPDRPRLLKFGNLSYGPHSEDQVVQSTNIGISTSTVAEPPLLQVYPSLHWNLKVPFASISISKSRLPDTGIVTGVVRSLRTWPLMVSFQSLLSSSMMHAVRPQPTVTQISMHC